MLSISCNLLKTTLKVQNRIVISPGDLGTDWELQPPLPSIRTKYHTCVASPRKDQNPKLKGRFLLNSYHFHTIVKSKNCQLNYPKSESVYFKAPIQAAKGPCLHLNSSAFYSQRVLQPNVLSFFFALVIRKLRRMCVVLNDNVISQDSLIHSLYTLPSYLGSYCLPCCNGFSSYIFVHLFQVASNSF